ncbi:hypothetical protein DFQ28_009577 [Apophysomyces sp. BC1034]|nr:hypothetical protein DFQ29_005048 [Apophysomyces sp. BC1021]KAG0185295.1 hypothetical protein DFQ28_009577 [Apophysomyces sp. BC1034]
MGNESIHTSSEIDELTASRGYKCVYLPPYSLELNPIEQFWSVVRNKVKRSELSDKEDLRTRITETCNTMILSSNTMILLHENTSNASRKLER